MNLPNKITISRVLLAPGFVACLLYWEPGRPTFRIVALIVFLVACLTDAVDGYLARKEGAVTHLGSLIDPLADKILLVSAFLGLTLMSHMPDEMHVPAWLTVLVVSRDVFIIFGAAVIFVVNHRIEVFTNLLGKATTVFQMMLIAGLLAKLPAVLIGVLIAATGMLTFLSGASYLKAASEALSKGGNNGH